MSNFNRHFQKWLKNIDFFNKIGPFQSFNWHKIYIFQSFNRILNWKWLKIDQNPSILIENRHCRLIRQKLSFQIKRLEIQIMDDWIVGRNPPSLPKLWKNQISFIFFKFSILELRLYKQNYIFYLSFFPRMVLYGGGLTVVTVSS